MTQLYYTIFDSLSDEENYLETDGEGYWWIDNGKYQEVPENIFKTFMGQKIVHPKRIDDETTCYYMTQEAREKISPLHRIGDTDKKS